MNIKKRLKQYLDFKDISDYRFQKDIGATNGYLAKGDTMRSDYLENILAKYKDLNLMWLLSGEGDMILSKGEILKNDVPLDHNINDSLENSGYRKTISVALPESGFQKIIHSNGKIEEIALSHLDFVRSVAESAPVYGNNSELLEDKIEMLQDQIGAYKEIINEQKDLIKQLKTNKERD